MYNFHDFLKYQGLFNLRLKKKVFQTNAISHSSNSPQLFRYFPTKQIMRLFIIWEEIGITLY